MRRGGWHGLVLAVSGVTAGLAALLGATEAVALVGGVHGRTDRPAQFSHSTRKAYVTHLATFRDRDNLLTVEANAVDQLHDALHGRILRHDLAPPDGGRRGTVARQRLAAEARHEREHVLVVEGLGHEVGGPLLEYPHSSMSAARSIVLRNGAPA